MIYPPISSLLRSAQNGDGGRGNSICERGQQRDTQVHS